MAAAAVDVVVVVEVAAAVSAGFPDVLDVAAAVVALSASVDAAAGAVGARLKSAADVAGRPVAAAIAAESVPDKVQCCLPIDSTLKGGTNIT